MAKIKHKVWTKLSQDSAPILKTLDADNADILSISKVGNLSDPEIIHVVPYGSDVETQNLLQVVADLVNNDTKINNEIIASNEIISEGVFDVVSTSLNESQQLELDILNQKIGNETALTPDETVRYNYLIKLKYGYKFNLTVDTFDGTKFIVGPGKFKVVEEESSNVYFIPEVYEFIPDEITEEDYYRLDLITAVFRDTENGGTPRLIYDYGVQQLAPSPSYVTTNRTLTSTYGTFPIWSILFKRTGTVTSIIRITQVFDWVGLNALLTIKNMEPHVRESTSGLSYYSVNHYKEVPLRDFNGSLLTGDFGEGTVVENLSGPSYTPGDQSKIPAIVQSAPNNFGLLRNGDIQTIPFQLTETYSDYLSILDVEFKQFDVAIDKTITSVLEDQREGLELHVYTATQFSTETKLKEFSVDIATYNNITTSSLVGSPIMPVGSVAFKVNCDMALLTYGVNDDATISPAASAVRPGDFVMVTKGHGQYQISEIMAIHGLIESQPEGTPTGTIVVKDVLVTKPFKITLDRVGTSTTPSIAFFSSETEQLVGNQIRDEYGNTSAWFFALTNDEKVAVNAAYPFSNHTGVTKLPWNSGDDRPDLKTTYENADIDILGNYRRVSFPMKVRLKLNKWYFIKSQVFQKQEPYDIYNDAGKPRIIYTNPNHGSVQTFDSLNCWYATVYRKNFGRYDETTEEGKRILLFSDEYGDIQQEFNYRITDGKPLYWKLVAKNLDDEVMTEPPAMVDNIGTVYVDVVRGKILFNQEDMPNKFKISCNINNVLHGASDTENLLHIENNSDVVTLAKKIITMDNDIAVLKGIFSMANVVLYRGPNSILEKYADGQYGLLNDNVKGLGTVVYCSKENGDPIERTAVEQRYPVSRLWFDCTDKWSVAKAGRSNSINIYADTTEANTILGEVTIPTVDVPTGTINEADPEYRVHFRVAAAPYIGEKVVVKRLGVRLSDRTGSIAKDLGLNRTIYEWEDLWMTLHNDLNEPVIPAASGVHWSTTGLGGEQYGLSIPATRVKTIYEEFSKRGPAADAKGYCNVIMSTGATINDNLFNNSEFPETIFSFRTIVNGNLPGSPWTVTCWTTSTFSTLITDLNALLVDTCKVSFDYTIVDSAFRPTIRFETLTAGDGQTIVVENSMGNHLFDATSGIIYFDENALDNGFEFVGGHTGYIGNEKAQDRMWAYFEFPTPVELVNGYYHAHFFVIAPTEDTTRPKIMKLNEAKWEWAEAGSIGDEPYPLWKKAFKLFTRPLLYEGGLEYTGGYGVDDFIPFLIDVNSNPVIALRDGSASADTMNWSLDPTDYRYNKTPDVDVVDVYATILNSYEQWQNWQYESYIGIDGRNGRIRIPNEFPEGYTHDWVNSKTFAEFNGRWPYTSFYTKSMTDPDDINVSLYDRRFPYIKVRNEVLDVLDDTWERARIEARSVLITWMSGKKYMPEDLVVVGNRIYKSRVEHISSATFIEDILKWRVEGGGNGSQYDVNIGAFTHTFVPGDVVYYNEEENADYGWTLAIADTNDHIGFGVVTEVPDTHNFTVTVHGFMEDAVGSVASSVYTQYMEDEEGDTLLPNTWYYLSSTNAGKLTKSRPRCGQKILLTANANNPDYPGTDPLNPWVTSCWVKVEVDVPALQLIVQNFTNTNGVMEFPLDFIPYSDAYVWVSIRGVTQHDFTLGLDNKTLTFDEALSGQPMRVQYAYALETPAPGGTMMTQKIVAEEGQTVFNFSLLEYGLVAKKYCVLTIDNIIVDDDDYEITAAKAITLNSACVAGEEVRIKAMHFDIIAKSYPAEETVLDPQLGKVQMYRGNREIISRTIPSYENMLSIGPVEVVADEHVIVSENSRWVII